MATKINQMLQELPPNSVIFSSWMSECGVSRAMQYKYVKSEWLDKLATGVYMFKGSKPTLFDAMSSYNKQLEKSCFVGASTALDLRGYSHFVAMGRPLAYIFTKTDERLPNWLVKHSWDMELRYFTTSIFANEMFGIEHTAFNGRELLVSSPERAFLECLHLSPTYFPLMDIYYVMEMLTTLRPKLLQQLLELCSSVKVKRLFLYMAEKSGHSWFRALDLDKIDLGSGKRMIEKNGVYNSKYMITLPNELVDYE